MCSHFRLLKTVKLFIVAQCNSEMLLLVISRQLVKQLSADTTAVIISHRFSTVRMADRILVLSGGQVEEEGSHDALLARGGRYAELFELQAAGYR